MDPDALTRPLGPLPPGTYWRRRAVALAVLALAVLLVTRMCSGGAAEPRRGVPMAGSSSAASLASLGPGPTPTTAAPSTPSAPSATVAAAPPPCADGDLGVTAATDQPSYATGESVRFTLTVRNTSARTCTRDVGPGARLYVVISGSDRIWSNLDCARGAAAVTTLPAGASKAFSVTWSGVRSAPGCPTGQPAASAGTYRLTARLGSLAVPGPVFTLR